MVGSHVSGGIVGMPGLAASCHGAQCRQSKMAAQRGALCCEPIQALGNAELWDMLGCLGI